MPTWCYVAPVSEPRTAPGVSYVVARLDRAIRREVEQRAKEHGLTLPQYTALSILRRQSGLSNAQLARRSFVRPQSMNQVIVQLERSGLIERSPDAHHRRVLRTTLTAEGRKVLAACDRDVAQMEAVMLADLSDPDREQLLRSMVSCVHQLGAGFPDVG
jgi:DNA-binding MarR family transcriptional regulator